MPVDFKKILKEHNLKPGDRIRLDNQVYEICVEQLHKFLFLRNVETDMARDIQYLSFDYEKVEPKRVRDLICKDIQCENCPLNCFRCDGQTDVDLKTRLEALMWGYPELERIREIIEEDLNKVITWN